MLRNPRRRVPVPAQMRTEKVDSGRRGRPRGIGARGRAPRAGGAVGMGGADTGLISSPRSAADRPGVRGGPPSPAAWLRSAPRAVFRGSRAASPLRDPHSMRRRSPRPGSCRGRRPERRSGGLPNHSGRLARSAQRVRPRIASAVRSSSAGFTASAAAGARWMRDRQVALSRIGPWQEVEDVERVARPAEIGPRPAADRAPGRRSREPPPRRTRPLAASLRTDVAAGGHPGTPPWRRPLSRPSPDRPTRAPPSDPTPGKPPTGPPRDSESSWVVVRPRLRSRRGPAAHLNPTPGRPSRSRRACSSVRKPGP
jgi:hypothetical protein